MIVRVPANPHIRDLKQERTTTAVKTSVKKMNLRSFKLNRVYLDPLNMSNAGDFSWSWILKDFIQVQKQEGKFVVVLFTSSIKRQIRRFHVVIVQWTSRKWTKKRGARAELLFWSLKLLFFWSRRCGRRRSCLSSLFLLSQKNFPPKLLFRERQFSAYITLILCIVSK